jgi:GAF domain-containing protein
VRQAPDADGRGGADERGAVPVRPGPADRMVRLLEAALSLGTDLDLGMTLQRVVDTAAELVGARYGALGVGWPGREAFADLYSAGLDAAQRRRVCETGRLPDHDVGGIGVPIMADGEIYGQLGLTGKREGAFTDEDQVLLRTLAAQAGIAVDNARTYGTARQRERWIQGAAAVTTALLTGEPEADALLTVAESARALAGADAGLVLLPTPAGGMRIAVASTADSRAADVHPHRRAGPGGGTPRREASDMVGQTIFPGSPILDQLLGGRPVFLDDAASDSRIVTDLQPMFGPSMLLPLQSGGKLIGTLALPRYAGGRPYTSTDRLLASQFVSQAALALVLADARHNREQLLVYEDRDRIARDLHDLVVQRLFATEMMLESTRRRAGPGATAGLLDHAVDELDSTIQEVRTTIFALQQPPAAPPTGVRARVLREADAAADLLGFRPSVHFRGPVDSAIGTEASAGLLVALRGALVAAHRRSGVTSVEVVVEADARMQDGRPAVRLSVTDDGTPGEGGLSDGAGTTAVWVTPR